MRNRSLNTLLLLVLTIVVSGAGYYATEVQQPAELQRLEDEKKLARLQQAQLEQLFIEEAASQEQADEVLRQWQARYKYIPDQLKTPDIVQYLEDLSRTGFEQFEVKLKGQSQTQSFNFYLFDVSGTAFYSDLYRLVWDLENNPNFYQIIDLDLAHQNVFKINEDTGKQRHLDMVSFSMELKVFYNGTEGLSAPEGEPLDVPAELFPARQLAHNSFHPIVRTDLPPNDELLLDVENAVLLSIVGDRAMLQDKNGQHIVKEGDRVYLGRIVKIDPVNSMIRASLHKGGVTDIVEVAIDGDEAYRQAQLPNTRLIPGNQ